MALRADLHALLRNAVETYALAGVPILPLYEVRDGRCACGRSDCDRPGKHPARRTVCTAPVPIRPSWRGGGAGGRPRTSAPRPGTGSTSGTSTCRMPDRCSASSSAARPGFGRPRAPGPAGRTCSWRQPDAATAPSSCRAATGAARRATSCCRRPCTCRGSSTRGSTSRSGRSRHSSHRGRSGCWRHSHRRLCVPPRAGVARQPHRPVRRGGPTARVRRDRRHAAGLGAEQRAQPGCVQPRAARRRRCAVCRQRVDSVAARGGPVRTQRERSGPHDPVGSGRRSTLSA